MAAPVAESLWRITTPLPFRPRTVHAYLAALADGGWMLVDGGIDSDDAWAALDAGVREVAGAWSAVRLLVVTHMHLDHLGLAARAVERSGAPLVMGRLDAERAAHAVAHPEEEARYRAALVRQNGAPAALADPAPAPSDRRPPPAVDGTLPGGEAPLDGAPGWTSVPTPGHTAGHVSLLRDADRVLVAGDAVLPRVTPTLGVNRQSADPVGDYLAALDRIEAHRPVVSLGGHGDPVTDVPGRVAELRASALGEGERVLGLLAAGGATAWEVARRRYGERDLPRGAWMQALRETRAHLDRLAADGRVRADAGAEVVRFSPL